MPGILIIEDDNELRDMLKTALVESNFTVMEAENGKEAIIHFRTSLTDLIVTDLIMPEEDGLNAILKIKKIKPSVKIIAISGGGKAAPGNYLEMAKTLGADAIFSKPFSVMDLISKIEELLEIEQYE
ncbi:MAG: response regulator [Bacteroidales bacterium]|nr:response regulator [Bacteroidales bacterium]